MPTISHDINAIPNVRRIENFPKDEMNAYCMELTHAVYPHEEIYGQYCTLEEHIDCPPEDVFRYLADVRTLEEWTYSLRDFEPCGRRAGRRARQDRRRDEDLHPGRRPRRGAMTVDYHCAWDQGDKLWMIYLMRVVPAQLVLNKPGSVVLWTQLPPSLLRQEPVPETAPGRPQSVGRRPVAVLLRRAPRRDAEPQAILEYRHKNGLPICPRRGAPMSAISLIATASYMPETVVDNAFFGAAIRRRARDVQGLRRAAPRRAGRDRRVDDRRGAVEKLARPPGRSTPSRTWTSSSRT